MHEYVCKPRKYTARVEKQLNWQAEMASTRKVEREIPLFENYELATPTGGVAIHSILRVSATR